MPSITVRGWRAATENPLKDPRHTTAVTLLKTNRVASAAFLPVPLTKLISRSLFRRRSGWTDQLAGVVKFVLFLSGNATVRKI